MATREELLATIGNFRLPDAERDAAKAAFEAAVASEISGGIQRGVEVFLPVLGELISEIKLHRLEIEKAAEASSKSSDKLVWWTRVMAAATVVLRRRGAGVGHLADGVAVTGLAPPNDCGSPAVAQCSNRSSGGPPSASSAC